MQYMGGKFRLAKWICPILTSIMQERGLRHFVDLFCGSCNIVGNMQHVTGNRYANDLHADLIAMWQAVQTGWRPPESVTPQMHKQLMATRGQAPDPLRAFVGFGCSYRGKYFGGFDPSYSQGPSQRSVAEKADLITGVRFTSGDFRRVRIPKRSLVYCDIPYQSTEKYSVGKFPHDEFCDWAEQTSRTNPVVVSEYHRNVAHRNVIATRESVSFMKSVHHGTPTLEALVLLG